MSDVRVSTEDLLSYHGQRFHTSKLAAERAYSAVVQQHARLIEAQQSDGYLLDHLDGALSQLSAAHRAMVLHGEAVERIARAKALAIAQQAKEGLQE